MAMNSPPPLPRTSAWDAPAARITVLALWAANTVFWIYSFRFLLARSNPMGDGFDMLPAVLFTVIFFSLALPSGIKAVRGYGLRSALTLSFVAAMLNTIIFMAVASANP